MTGANSIIENCTAKGNRGDGIRLSTGSLALGNDSGLNGLNGDGAGIAQNELLATLLVFAGEPGGQLGKGAG